MTDTLISPNDSKAVRAAALRLPEDEREALINDLMDSLKGAEPDQLSPEWLAVIQQRLDDYKSGKVVPVPGELVRQRAHQRVGL